MRRRMVRGTFRGEFAAASLKRLGLVRGWRSPAAFRGEFAAASLKHAQADRKAAVVHRPSAANSPRPH